MTAEGEREKAAAELQHLLRNLDQVEANNAATAMRLARIREAIHGLGCSSVAQALAEYDTSAAVPRARRDA